MTPGGQRQLQGRVGSPTEDMGGLFWSWTDPWVDLECMQQAACVGKGVQV